MEAARRACGGHGYSLLSGLPTLFTHYVQNVTWEGDNNVMLLQVTPAASLLHPAWLCATGGLMCMSVCALPCYRACASLLVTALSSLALECALTLTIKADPSISAGCRQRDTW